MNLETRTFKCGLEARASENDAYIGTLIGHAAPFDSPSLEFAGWERPWVEMIQHGAFTRTLKENTDIKGLSQHDSASILARSPNTMTLSEDDKGLAFEMKLVPTQLARDVFALVKAGVLDAMSFGFSPRSVKWDEGKERDTRTLLDVDLYEVSVVTWPAYPASKVGARGLELSISERDALKAEREQSLSQSRANSSEQIHHLLRYWERRVRLF